VRNKKASHFCIINKGKHPNQINHRLKNHVFRVASQTTFNQLKQKSKTNEKTKNNHSGPTALQR
jgi:hypothetical protein